jgi:hypothetical protein
VNGWRGTWARAQITGAVFSTLVWIVVCGLSLPAFMLTIAVGIAVVVGRYSRAMLWWRYGAVPANDFQRGAILTAIIPIASLRGRNQPTIWIGRRLGADHAAMPNRAKLVIAPEFIRQVANGELSDRQASAIISQALGHAEVHDSTLVIAIDAYCLPWRIVQIFTGAASQIAARSPILGISWKIRWIVFGAAVVDSYRNARWAALVGVLVIAMLSWSTGHFQKRWLQTLESLGDQRTICEGLGPNLADLIQCSDRSLAAAERADRLRSDRLDRTTGRSKRSPDAARSLSVTRSADRLERRACVGRRSR